MKKNKYIIMSMMVLIAIIGIVAIIPYAIYLNFFLDNPPSYGPLLLVMAGMMVVIIFILLPLEWLSDKYPNSKTIKSTKKMGKRTLDALGDGLHAT